MAVLTTCPPATNSVNFHIGDSEQRLISQLQHGSNAAMRDFYTRYGGRLTAVCARYIADDEDLKDVVQDTLVSVFTHINTFNYRGKGSLLAWASRIAANRSLSFLREKKQTGWLEYDDKIADIPVEEDPPIADVPPEKLQECIRRLPPGYRAVLNLYVFENKSHNEIARLLGITASTSASQLHRAKALLTKEIRQYINSINPPQ